MSGYHLSEAYHPFSKPQQSTHEKDTQHSFIVQNVHNKYDFSQRLNDLLNEKSALKIDYQDIHRDLQSYGFPIQATDSHHYHSGLDKIRLKAGLKIMDNSFQEIYDNQHHETLNNAKNYFQKEVCKVFEILSRDYKRVSNFFAEKLRDKEKLNLSELEKELQNHIEFYNHFTELLHNYLGYVTGQNHSLKVE